MTTANGRTAAYDIDPQYLERWSPRAFDGQPMPLDDLLTMFEAARWAPSTFNSQPWRFVYALRGTPAWDKLFPLLVEFNQSWAHTASALVIIFSAETFKGPGGQQMASWSHSFDAGAASAAMTFQALKMGYYAHGMTGFLTDKAAETLGAPEGYRPEAAFAIGRRGDKSVLSEQLQAGEAPSPRNPLDTMVFEGGFAEGAA